MQMQIHKFLHDEQMKMITKINNKCRFSMKIAHHCGRPTLTDSAHGFFRAFITFCVESSFAGSGLRSPPRNTDALIECRLL